MNKRPILRGAFIALLCFISFGMSLLVPGNSIQAASPSQVISSGSLAPSVASTNKEQAYWTPARMQSALSSDLLLSSAKPGPQVLGATGPAQSQAPTAPKKALTAKAVVTPAKVNSSVAQVLGYPYAYPYSTVGKVFFTDPATRLNYQCSGTLINSKNLSTVDTAGHCVAAGGGQRFYTNWAYCAQYYNGCASGYLWAARTLWTNTNWYNKGWFAYDYGAAVLSPNTHGYAVNFIGGAGWAYNQSYNQTFYAFGFPAEAPFDGSRLWYCPSTRYTYDTPSSGPTALSITCNMNGGSSGGGWLISVGGSFGYVNGHNDYTYSNDLYHMYSPYYGSDWFNVFNTAQNS